MLFKSLLALLCVLAYAASADGQTACKPPFDWYQPAGKCLMVEWNSHRIYFDAAKKCAKLGGKLLTVDKPWTFVRNLENIVPFRDHKFYMGGSEIFMNADSIAVNSYDNQKASEFVLNEQHKYKVDDKDLVVAFRRFSGKANVDELNEKNPLTTRCMVIDFNNDGPQFVACHSQQNYICEQVDDEAELRWSPWFDLDSHWKNQDESLAKVTAEYNNGLNIPGLSLCSNPINVQCRDADTYRYYTKYKKWGKNLPIPCVNNRIKCVAKSNKKSHRCGNIQIRFQCVNTFELDCKNALVSERCLSQNTECKNRAFGPQCEKQVNERVGTEKVGVRKCTYQSIDYEVKQCVARGDPHYYTPDGNRLNFHGKCSYNLVSSCNQPTDAILPSFSVVVTNGESSVNNLVSSTKAFDFIIDGTTYSFKRGTKFQVDGFERSLINYKDDKIEITIQMKGGFDGNPKVTIDTSFCVQVVWDNKMALYVRFPSGYMGELCGMCGNFDGNPDNDLQLPGTSVDATPDEFGHYFQVSANADANECTDTIVNPPDCTWPEKQKYMGLDYCGIFDPNGEAQFAKYILSLGDDETNKYNRQQLNGLMQDCIQDHCWLSENEFSRCYELETSVEEVAQDLQIDDLEILDNMWRQASSCIHTEQTACLMKPNSHYEASYKFHCMPTCATSAVPPQACPEETTGSGCVCDDNFFLNSNLDCVPLDECEKECYIELENGQSFTLRNGESIVAEPCMKVIKCNYGTYEEEITTGCSPHAQCSKDGRECVCRQGFNGDGRTCKVDKTCRDGYHAFGEVCYKLVPHRTDWHSAAIICGADGAHLARYDMEQNLELENFLILAHTLFLESMASTRHINCKSNRYCPVGVLNSEMGISIRLISGDPVECGDFKLSENRRSIIAGGTNCNGTFSVLTVQAQLWLYPPNVDYWVGGNTHVLGHNKRMDKSPFQVDPPRMIDDERTGDPLGCFFATLNWNDQLILRPNSDCEIKHPFICEYENNQNVDYNPTDIVGIHQKVNKQTGVEKCNELGRPLLRIGTKSQLKKAKEILLNEIKGNAWIDGHWDEIDGWTWSDRSPFTITSFEYSNIEPKPKHGNRETHCMFMNKEKGYWKSETCSFDKYVLCGPPHNVKPTAFTPPMRVIVTPSSLQNIKSLFQAYSIEDYICDSPVEVKCKAKSIQTDMWVTNYDQHGNTMTCTVDEISCKDDQGLDCTTLSVQFLCPETENQCTELAELGATACDGGRECLPVTNHYFCKCPLGVTYHEEAKKCIDHCGVCTGKGDPHYRDFSGNLFDFQGECEYTMSAVCEEHVDITAESYEINTKNVDCGKGNAGTCIEEVSIHLNNMVFADLGNNVKIRKDIVMRVKANDSEYTMDGMTIRQTKIAFKDLFAITVKKNYFDMVVPVLKMRIFLSGTNIQIFAPSEFEGKMCGLCGDCNTNTFLLRNGTAIDITKVDNKWDRDTMVKMAQSWVIPDPDHPEKICQVPAHQPSPCTDELEPIVTAKTACGIFKDDNGPLKDCFGITEINPNEYYDDCVYDACTQPEHIPAVCTMVKAYAQACLDKGIILDWRSDGFCPMHCEADEIYRSVASCEPTCGQVTVNSLVCTEAKEEGCICKSGMKREGANCVLEADCGCDIQLAGGINWHLAIGEETLSMDCTEKIVCEGLEDGSSEPVYTTYMLPQNSVCKSGPPTVTECAHGYTLNSYNFCEKDPVSCTDGYENVDGLCLKTPNLIGIWRHQLQACNEIDGHLTVVDTEEKLEAVKSVLVKEKLSEVYIAGRAKVVVKDNHLELERYLEQDQVGKVEFTHFDVSDFLLNQAVIEHTKKDLNKNNLPEFPLAFMVTLGPNNEARVIAVETNRNGNASCQQRNTQPDETDWFGPCNTDTIMSDNGDQEMLSNMLLDDNCLVCPFPSDVLCIEADHNDPNENIYSGVCETNSQNLYYTCNEGPECIDKSVKTQCTKDIDECANDHNDCPINSDCINQVGAYKCKCHVDFPLMIDGDCLGAGDCSMKGPQLPNGYVFDFVGFSEIPGIWDYDCSYKLVSPTVSLYATTGDLPYVNFAVILSRDHGILHITVSGTIYNPLAGGARTWQINDDLISRKKILFGESSLFEEDLNYESTATRTQFIFKNPDVLIIKSLGNSHYKARITTNPWGVHLQISKPLLDFMHGVCLLTPETQGDRLYMTPDEAEEVSLGDPICPSGGPNPTTSTEWTSTTTTEGPTSTTPTHTTNDPGVPCLTKVFCNVLQDACGVDLDHCRANTCSGHMPPCDYLAREEFAPNCHDKEAVRSLIETLYCDSLCDPNEKFTYTVISKQPTCSNPDSLPVEGEDAIDDYEFGCVCKPGFVLSGTTCIREEDCGCVTEDGIYKLPGKTWRSIDCKWIYTCMAGGQIVKVNAECGQNATCVQTDQGPECQCIEDHYGNPDLPEGCSPGCVGCNQVCYNYTRGDGEIEVRCNCTRGFISNCSDCEDIDECVLALHSCDLSKEICVNVPGGYKCPCRDGFHLVNGECVDVNECRNETICGTFKGCLNTIGDYSCSCCVGYRYVEATDECVRDEENWPTMPANAPCCAFCTIPTICDPYKPGKVCYEDANGEYTEYENGTALFRNLCLFHQDLIEDNVIYGLCPEPTEPPADTTTGEPPVTPGDSTPIPPYTHDPNGPGTIHNCNDYRLPLIVPAPPMVLRTGPVCGPTSLLTEQEFPSYNKMLAWVCEQLGGVANMPKSSHITAYSGPCVNGSNPATPEPTQPPNPTGEQNKTVVDPKFTHWYDWQQCEYVNATCGIGIQVRYRVVIPNYDPNVIVKEPQPEQLQQDRVCFNACVDPDPPHNPIDCPEESICDMIDPVCGSIGPGGAANYHSVCVLNVLSCKAGLAPVLLYHGECDPDDNNPHNRLCERDGPLRTKVKYYYNDTYEECLGPLTEIWTCNGLLCDGSSNTCCGCVDKSPVQVTVSCYSHNPRQFTKHLTHVHYTSTQCICKDVPLAERDGIQGN